MKRRSLLLLSLRLIALLGVSLCGLEVSRFARRADSPCVAVEESSDPAPEFAFEGMPVAVELVVVSVPRVFALLPLPVSEVRFVETRRAPPRAPPVLS